jgi:hypothetical protein
MTLVDTTAAPVADREHTDLAQTSHAMAFPILPGKLAAWKQFCQELQGPRRSEYQESRRRLGMTRELVWHQQTPQGDFALVYGEAEDWQKANEGIATSQAPFDQWFRAHVKDLHGVDFTQPSSGPPPELVFDGSVS